MIYINLAGFGFLTAAATWFLVRTIRQDGGRFYRDAEFYGLVMYALAALSYFQAVARVIGGGHVSLDEQRSINFIMMFALAWSVAFTAIRKGFLDEIIKRFV